MNKINPLDVIANLLANKVRFSTRTFGENEADTLEIFSKNDWHLCKSLFPRLFDLSNDERSEPVAKATFRL